MCVHYNKSSDIIKARKAIKLRLQELIRKNSIDNYYFLLSVEDKILLLIEKYGERIRDVLDSYYELAAKAVEDGNLTAWETKVIEDKINKEIENAINEVSHQIHLAYADEYDSEERSENMWAIVIMPYIFTRITNIGRVINDNTKADIRSIIGSNDPVEAVRRLRDKDNLARAITIASTEIRAAQSFSERKTMEQVSAVKVVKKYWLGVLDDRIREAHFNASQMYNQNNPIAFSDYFMVNGEMLKYPRDTNASAKNLVNCRCYLGYIVT